MIRPTLLFVLTLILTACTSPDVGDCPVDLDVITPVMTDLHLAEALSTEIPVLVRDSMQEVYYNKVLEDHGFSRTSFDSLMWIVRKEPAWVDSLYTRIGVSLARMETEPEE
ncbi:DUF4296 domain-containing protein [Neolewinella aurantiaca]|uniref:DUF4296 domain-containing protein n=1 Tax=Neolewinella aurantiaca TaxID=2602767 RepID=A0A5C7FXV1_9BACT|nr:DUF4296 domain-containing protein [Neolewinella aurantiaca]TXF91289.1 DUF4296 domain-containing protein [Neolewinella aurantiaca]